MGVIIGTVWGDWHVLVRQALLPVVPYQAIKKADLYDMHAAGKPLHPADMTKLLARYDKTAVHHSHLAIQQNTLQQAIQ